MSTGPADIVQPSASFLEVFPDAVGLPPFRASLPEPSAPVSSTPPMVIDISELLASHAVVQATEATDRATLSVLLNETRETLRPQMFVWAAAGFPAVYVVRQFTLSPPAICSDGVTRNAYDYVVYLLGQEMGPTIAAVQALCVGVQISYSFQGNTLRIHVSRS